MDIWHRDGAFNKKAVEIFHGFFMVIDALKGVRQNSLVSI